MLQSELTLTALVHRPPGDQICQSCKGRWKAGRVVAERDALESACPGSVVWVTLGKLPSLPNCLLADGGNRTNHGPLPRGPDEFNAYETLQVQGTVGARSR